MMMLELDYMNSFNDQFVNYKSETLHFGNLTLVFLTIFVLLMPILLMNLLVGRNPVLVTYSKSVTAQ